MRRKTFQASTATNAPAFAAWHAQSRSGGGDAIPDQTTSVTSTSGHGYHIQMRCTRSHPCPKFGRLCTIPSGHDPTLSKHEVRVKTTASYTVPVKPTVRITTPPGLVDCQPLSNQ